MSHDGRLSAWLLKICRLLLIVSPLILTACQSGAPRVSLHSVNTNEWQIDANACLSLYRPMVELRWQFSGGSVRHVAILDAIAEALNRQQREVLQNRSRLRVEPAGAIQSESLGALFGRLGLTLEESGHERLLQNLIIDPSLLPDRTECVYGAVLLLDAWLFEGQSRPSRQQLLWAVWSTRGGRLMMLASSEQLSQSHHTLSDRIDEQLLSLLEQMP